MNSPKSRSGDDAVTAIFPYRNKWALAAWYVGVVSLVPIPILHLVPGVAAIVLGVIALRKAAREPLAKGRLHAWLGIALGLVSVFVCAPVVTLLVYIGYLS